MADLHIEGVEPEHQEPLLDLIKEYSDLFADKDCKLGCYNQVSHKIDTQGFGPVRQKAYRAPFRQQQEIDKQV